MPYRNAGCHRLEIRRSGSLTGPKPTILLPSVSIEGNITKIWYCGGGESDTTVSTPTIRCLLCLIALQTDRHPSHPGGRLRYGTTPPKTVIWPVPSVVRHQNPHISNFAGVRGAPRTNVRTSVHPGSTAASATAAGLPPKSVMRPAMMGSIEKMGGGGS